MVHQYCPSACSQRAVSLCYLGNQYLCRALTDVVIFRMCIRLVLCASVRFNIEAFAEYQSGSIPKTKINGFSTMMCYERSLTTGFVVI